MEEQNLNPNQHSVNPKKSKMLSIALGSIGLFLVMSIIFLGALLASHTWNPSWNPFKQAPDKGIQKIFKE